MSDTGAADGCSFSQCRNRQPALPCKHECVSEAMMSSSTCKFTASFAYPEGEHD